MQKRWRTVHNEPFDTIPLVSRNPDEFRRAMLQQLAMEAISPAPGLTVYHGQSGFLRIYGRPGLYEFGVADYTIEQPFSIAFESRGHLLRFGALYDGETRFALQGAGDNTFSPSVFVTHEHNLQGIQGWETGQHYCGAEFTVYPAFFEELDQRYGGCGVADLFERLSANHNYRYLPVSLIAVLQRAVEADAAGRFSALTVEALVLEGLAILHEETLPGSQGPLSCTRKQGIKASVGAGHQVTLTESDCQLVKRAHEILTSSYADPPTIERLSQELALSPQKLKAGFKHAYHTTIGAYTNTLRMNQAALLLCTTDESVGSIARRMGYAHPSNFIKAFRRSYSCSPRAYRLREGKR